MLVLEFKVKAKQVQRERINEAIRTAQFVRNKCLRYWMDGKDIGKYDVYKFTTQLAKDYGFVDELNSQARQAACERAWAAISRFFDNCRKNLRDKGYPKFKKNCRSVEYKTSGWKLSENRKQITFRDKKGIGTVKLIGTRDLNHYQPEQINRVRLLRRADGYYVQFCIDQDVRDSAATLEPTKQAVGIDVGLKYFLADSNGQIVQIPQFYRQAQKQLNRANRKKSKKFRKGVKHTKNYCKARTRYARKHLRVSRQREEFAKRVALRIIQSNDLVAYEDLNVKGLVKSKLAKSINDAAWATFRKWLEYFGFKYGKATTAVPPYNTSQSCSCCGMKVAKSLSTRTHNCRHCGYSEDRDVNAAMNILKLGLRTQGHWGTYAWGETPSWAVGATLLSNGDSLNQESPSL